MGEVFLVRDTRDGQRYALKLLTAGLLADSTAQARFEREVKTLLRLGEHPHLVAIRDGGRTPSGQPWCVMDYVPGPQLKQAMREGLPREDLLRLLEEVSAALGHAHALGVVHRDVKPANVLVDQEGRARLTDFGLALDADTHRRLTMTGELLGTPLYMAPEQAAPSLGPIGPATDVYAVGAILYEGLCGRTPYVGRTALEVYASLVEGTPIAAPSALAPLDDPRLEEVCLRALARAPQDRYPDGAALQEALAALRRGSAPSARSPLPLLLLATAASLLLMSTSLVVAWRGSGPATREGPPLAELQRLLDGGAPEQVLARGAGFEDDPEAGPLLLEARARTAQALLRRDQPAAARKVLRGDEVFPELAELLARLGDVAGARAAAPEPALAATLAAWAGDAPAARTALEALPDPAMARALAAELSPFAPELSSGPRWAEGPGSPWQPLAEAEEALAAGLPDLALLRLERARTVPGELRARASYLASRAQLACGELEAAAEEGLAALSATNDGLTRGRLLGWLAQVVRGLGEDPLALRVRERAGGDPLDLALQVAPGVPEVGAALLAAGLPSRGPLTPLEAARAGDLARLREALIPRGLPAWLGLSRAERALGLLGQDGPEGLLLARALERARLAALGPSPAAAREALSGLELAARLRPHAAAPRLGLAWAHLALGQVGEARAAADQALQRGGEDPLLRSTAVRTRRAALEPRVFGALSGAGPDMELEEELAQLAGGWAEAAAGLPAEDPLTGEARLQEAAARVERAALATRRGVAAPTSEALATLAPLLAAMEPAAFASGRAALFSAGDEAELFAALDSLAASRPAGSSRSLGEALRLRSQLGDPEAGLAAQALLGLEGDLPAWALLLAERAAAAEPGERAAWLERALRLAPELPELRYARACLREPFASGPGELVALGGAVARQADLVPRALARLEASAVAAAPPPSGAGLGGALAEALHQARGGGDPGAALVAATRALALDPEAGAGVYALRAALRALLAPRSAGAAAEKRVQEERRRDLLLAAAAAPWCGPVGLELLEGLPAGAARSAAEERLLAEGYLSNYRRVLRDPSSERRWSTLVPYLEKTVLGGELDLADSRDAMGLAAALMRASPAGEAQLYPRLALHLRLQAGHELRDELDEAGLSFASLLPALEEELRPAAQAWHQSGSRRDGDPGAPAAPAREALLRLRTARGPLPRPEATLAAPGWRYPAGALPSEVELRARFLPLDVPLWEVTYQLRQEPRTALAALGRHERAGSPLAPPALRGPWSLGALQVSAPQDPYVAWELLEELAEGGEWTEALLALTRSAAYSLVETAAEVVCEGCYDELLGEVGEAPEALRPHRWRGLKLLAAAAGPQAAQEGVRVALRALELGAALDLAAAAGEGPRGQALREEARRLARELDPARIPGEQEDWRAWAFWGRARLASWEGDAAAAREAAQGVADSLDDEESEHALGRLRRAVEVDPRLARYRADPSLAPARALWEAPPERQRRHREGEQRR